MRNHYETVICPSCKSIELLEVIHTFPYWTYSGNCGKCNALITKDNWISTGHIWNEDMMDVLYKMKSNSVDVVITDPPYGVRKEEAWDDATLFIKRIKPWLDECLRVSKHTVVWFCANRMFPYIFSSIKPELFLREHHWKKPKGSQFAGASNNRIWYSSEPILVFTKDREATTHNFDEDSEWNYDDLEYDTIAKKIWNHPTIKPVGLINQLATHYSKPGQTILDAFGGSGTLAEVAIKTGRKYIIIEQDGIHFQTILTRIKNINAQTDLFR
jgi:DNA modification methylase